MESNKACNLSVYSAGHFVVDATSIFILSRQAADFIPYFILYNIIAFGWQLPIGIASDKIKSPKLFSLLALLLLALALFTHSATTTIVLIGVANAIYHIGAGTICLNITPTRATAPGIFIAFGALGLFVGKLVAGMEASSFIPLIPLTLLGLVIVHITLPKIDYDTSKVPIAYIGLLLLNLTIISRSFIGFQLYTPTNEIITAGIIAAAIFSGKFIGGIISDQIGTKATGIISLLGAAAMFYLWTPAIYIGIFLLNITTSITLVGTANKLKGYPGLAFGTTCLSLLMGYGLAKVIHVSPAMIPIVTIISILPLYLGLKNEQET